MGENNNYGLLWFEILTYHKKKYVIYGVGQWWYHSIDWRGGNYFHGRLPDSPVFNDVKSAEKWLKESLKNGDFYEGMELSGHHSGEHQCMKGCNDREVKTIYFSEMKLKS